MTTERNHSPVPTKNVYCTVAVTNHNQIVAIGGCCDVGVLQGGGNTVHWLLFEFEKVQLPPLENRKREVGLGRHSSGVVFDHF
jgi:hypothetical protein